MRFGGRLVRGLTRTGAGRPVDGGRGLTCAGRTARRVVIGRILARRSGSTTHRPLARACDVGFARSVVLWRGCWPTQDKPQAEAGAHARGPPTARSGTPDPRPGP